MTSPDQLQLVFYVDGPDSDLATLIEGTLEDDLEPFFFNCQISFMT